MRHRSLLPVAIVAVGFLGLNGCAGDKAPLKTIATGTVTYKGKPVPAGQILFVSATDSTQSGGGMIKSDGSYKAEGVPLGPVKIAIQTASLKKSMGGGPGGLPPAATMTDPNNRIDTSVKPVLLPAKYEDAATSGQTATIVVGDNVVNVTIE